ncbi:MAG TPA: hypothetical protein VN132_05935 [Bdellovibrio sp.]|nr:hypothetical protein [Bdellovibrio sp.]
MKFLFLCLTLGMIFCIERSSPTSFRGPASAVSHEGDYVLVNGTEGCPTSVTWIDQCAGFVLNPHKDSAELETEKFCAINRGVKVTSEKGAREITQVEQTERYVRKASTLMQNNVVLARLESTLIFDAVKDQFLWEYSRNQQGFSCLYSK